MSIKPKKHQPCAAHSRAKATVAIATTATAPPCAATPPIAGCRCCLVKGTAHSDKARFALDAGGRAAASKAVTGAA